jgi:hypothetical protein
MSGLVVVLLMSLACAWLPYALVERRWRWRWREIAAGHVAADAVGGAYRGGGTVPRFLTRAPGSVRLAAFIALWCGQWFVPLTCVGGITIIFGGAGLLTIPALIACAKSYRAGLSLLRRDPRLACFRARDAALWSLWTGGATLLLALLVTTAERFASLLLAVSGGCALVTLVILAQALLLLHVTRRWEDALFAASQHPTVVPRQGML